MAGMRGMRELYFNRRVALMLPLGFASGLPLALTGDTLTAWARTAGVSLTNIGLLGLVTLPYTVKFLWAPLVDRYALPFLDRRRSWILIFQLLLILAVCAMAAFDPVNRPGVLAAMAVLVALFSASQDICVDAYRTDILEEHQRGSGSAVFVSGYRLGMIMSGGVAMILAGHHIPWPAIYCTMGLAMTVGIGAVLAAPPAPQHIRPPATLRQAIVSPLKQILFRDRGWLIIAFVIIFKLPELTADRYTTPFLIDLKIPMETIGWIRQTFGLVVMIAGTLAGGWLVGRAGLYRSLWIVGALQPLTNLAFFALARYPESRAVLAGVIGTESFCIGLVTAAFGAYLMSLCDLRYSAFQYALLSSAMAITRVVGVVPAGKFAQAYGWSAFFALTAAIALPGLLMLPLLRGSTIRHEPKEEPGPKDVEALTPADVEASA